MKRVFAINGSAGSGSSNGALIHFLEEATRDFFSFEIFDDLKSLPHFDPELSVHQPPPAILHFRKQIEDADALLICTPEYVFSIPSGLKNALEWCVATTLFSEKPTGLITASASGSKGHEQLQLIMKTLMAKYTPETCLLIAGIRGRITQEGTVHDAATREALLQFAAAFRQLASE